MHDVTASSRGVLRIPQSFRIGSAAGSRGSATGSANIMAMLGATSANTSVTLQAIPATPAITSVSPSGGAAGTQVTISGSGFGSLQGTRTVLLGTNPANNVLSWTSTQIVAIVPTGSRSGNAQAQQNGIGRTPLRSASVTRRFQVSRRPARTGNAGDNHGFRLRRGPGKWPVWLGKANGQVLYWSDTQVIAEVVVGSTSGNAQILQNGVVSNAVAFTVKRPI